MMLMHHNILWVIDQEMPAGKHEHITTYKLEQSNQDIINN
jgi:hypothetical protein